MGAALNDGKVDTSESHSFGRFEVFDASPDFVGWNGRHNDDNYNSNNYLFIYMLPQQFTGKLKEHWYTKTNKRHEGTQM